MINNCDWNVEKSNICGVYTYTKWLKREVELYCTKYISISNRRTYNYHRMELLKTLESLMIFCMILIVCSLDSENNQIYIAMEISRLTSLRMSRLMVINTLFVEELDAAKQRDIFAKRLR